MNDGPEPLADRFRERKVLVTGAASGIGRACVRRFLAEGAEVALVDRDHSRLVSARETLAPSERAFPIPFDVCDSAAIEDGVARAAEVMGGIDGVVNSAGIDLYRPFERVRRDD